MAAGSSQLIFTDEEFARRWATLRENMALQRSELAIIVDADTVFYLTGFAGTPTTFQALIVPQDGPPTHFMRYAEQASFETTSYLEDGRYYDDIEDPVFTLANIIEEIDPPRSAHRR